MGQPSRPIRPFSSRNMAGRPPMTIAIETTRAGTDVTALARRLSGLRRKGQMRALLLIAPLMIFLMAVFVAPIAVLLTRSVDNSEVSDILPATAVALAAWNGESTPDEAVYAA